MTGIIRDPTPAERDLTPITSEGESGGFIPIATRRGRFKTPEDKFRTEIAKHEQEATEKGLPFASQVVWIETKEKIDNMVKNQMKKYGYIKEDIKMPEVDWNRYSDLKNFEKIGEGETYDKQLSKDNPGVAVRVKKTEYKFKGYTYMYRVMEDAESAVARARAKSNVSK